MAVLRYLLTPFLCTTDSTDDTAKSDWPSEDETSDEEYESDDDSSNAVNMTPAAATRVRHEADNNTIPATLHGHSTGIVPACRADCNTSSTDQPAAGEEIDTMCTPSLPSYIYRTSHHHHHHHTHRRRYVVYHTPPQQPSSSSVTRSNKSNKMPFWSRLLCRPEVYDPCVEAAPTAEALRLQRPNATTTTTRVSDAAYDTTHAVTRCAKDALPTCTQGVSECVASQDSDATAAIVEEDVCDSSKRSKTDIMSMTLTAPIAVVVVRQDMPSDAPGQPHDRTTQQHMSTNEESAVTTSAACVSSTATTTPSTSVSMCAAVVRPASTLRGFRVQDTRFMQGTWCTARHHVCTNDTTHTVTCVATLHDTLCRTECTSPCHTTHDTQHAGCTTDSNVTATGVSPFTTPQVRASLIMTPEQQQLSSDESEAATWRRHWAVLQAERTRVEQLRRVRLEKRKTEYAAWRELCTATFPLAASNGCTHDEYKGRQTTADDEGQQLSCTSETCTVVLHAEGDEDALPLSDSTRTTTTDDEGGEEAAQGISRQCSVAATLLRRRLARCCDNVHDVLGCSRRYIENAILTQRSQQVYALLALLSEARRHAWTLSCRLMQLYYYYIHPILQLTANETTTHSQSPSWASHRNAQELVATLLTRSSSSAVRAIHQQYLYDTRVTLDYQLFRYVFDRTWNRLMHDVRSYLGPPCRPRTLSHHTTCEAVQQKCIVMTRKRVTRDEGHTPNNVAEDDEYNAADLYSTTRPTRCAANIDGDVMLPLSHETRYTHHTTHGSVRYAATLLYALELFERQHSLQCAVHEVERWIAWSYAAMTTGSLHTILRDVNDNNNEEGCAVGSGAALSADADECDAAGTVTQLAVDTINSNNTCTTVLGDTTTQSATSEEKDSAVACYSNDDEQAECCSMSCTLSTTGLSVSPSLPQTPQLQPHTSHDDVPHVHLLSSCGTTTSSPQEKTDDVSAAASCAHLPMQWHKAQDDALRETVSEERRWRRLCTVIAANRALHTQHGSM